MGIGYDDADRAIERERFVENAGGAATTIYGKFRSFVDLKLLRARAWVTTAGTAAGHGFDIYVGTASVGTFDLGTSTAGVESSVTLNVAVPAGTVVNVKSLSDIVGKADVTFEYRRND